MQADTLGFGSGFDFAGLFSSRGAFALDKYEYHEVRYIVLLDTLTGTLANFYEYC